MARVLFWDRFSILEWSPHGRSWPPRAGPGLPAKAAPQRVVPEGERRPGVSTAAPRRCSFWLRHRDHTAQGLLPAACRRVACAAAALPLRCLMWQRGIGPAGRYDPESPSNWHLPPRFVLVVWLRRRA